jgi:hypothetical protein
MRGCFRVALGLLSTGLFMISAVGSRAQSAAKEKGFEAYRLVQTRNVFDPNRRAPRGEEQRRSGPPRSRNDSFTLTWNDGYRRKDARLLQRFAFRV